MQLGIFFSKRKNSKSVEAPKRQIESHDRYIFHTCLTHAQTAHFAHFRVHPPTDRLSCLCRNNFINWESRNKWNGNWVENAPWQEVGSRQEAGQQQQQSKWQQQQLKQQQQQQQQ